MTLCIAAIARRDQEIITVSDLLLSTDYMSQEASLKAWPLSNSNRWIGMFAGSPSVKDVVSAAVTESLGKGEETLTEVTSAFERACREELKRKIEGEILSPLGLDRERFLRRGRAYLGEDNFGHMLRKVEATRLETEFLVAGFEPDAAARIFSVSDLGVCTLHDSLGFDAIGSGYISALGALYATYEPGLSTLDLIYRVCEAKFRGESASGVGKYTMVMATNRQGLLHAIIPEAMEPIREAWEKHGRLPVPEEARTAIQQRLLPYKIYS